MKGMDAFERSVKDAMSGYEVPYNSADWVALERALRDGGRASKWTSAGLGALLIAGLTGLGIGGALLLQNVDAPAPQRISEFVPPAAEVAGPAATQPGTQAHLAMVQEELVASGAAADDEPAPETASTTTLPVATNNVVLDRSVRAGSTAAGSGSSTLEPAPAPDEGGGKPTNGASGLTFQPSVTEGCPGTTVEFVVGQLPDEGIYLWNFGDGSFSNKSNPSHTYSKPGKFEVMLSHSSTSGGSIMSKPSSDLIVIHEAPEATFNVQKQEYEGLVPSVHFENRSLGSSNQYLWDFGDGSTSTVAHPDHVFKKKGEYRVELTVTNAKGCVNKHDRVIRIDRDYNLEAAEDFSPNGDGVNETFIPAALKTLGLSFHMAIHDPVTGSILFETTDAQRPWNGRVHNKGEACPPGEYVWVVEMKDGPRFGGSYNGTVGLVR